MKQQKPVFRIFSQNTGLSHPDTLSLKEEKELLQEELKDSYFHLPIELQEIAGKTVYVINHERDAVTKYYMGWSAEDDLEYELGDRKFFDPSLDVRDKCNGTIKVNFTQKFVKTIAIGKVLGEKDKKVLLGMKLLVHSIIAHELLHAYQYHTNPVRALSNPIPPFNDCRSNCPEGLCDPNLLEETKKKIEYERDAIALQRSYVNSEAFNAFADSLDRFEESNPELFKKGAIWWLASNKHETSISEYYLRQYIREKEEGREFSDLLKTTYEGQYMPPLLVYQIKQLNDSFARSDTLNLNQAQDNLKGILRTWKCYCEPGTTTIRQRIQRTFPYLVLVNDRFNLELDRCKRMKIVELDFS